MYALYSDEFNEVLTQYGMPIVFPDEAQAQRVADHYPPARMRVIETDEPGVDPSDELLDGRAALGHTESG